MDHRKICERMFSVQADKNLSLTEFANACSVTKGAVNNWKHHGNNPDPKSILQFLSFYPDVDANYILHGEGRMYKKDNCSDDEGKIKSISRELEMTREILKTKEELLSIYRKGVTTN